MHTSISEGDMDTDKALDRNDPNYDSEEERGVVLTQQDWLKGEIQNYKHEVSKHHKLRMVMCVMRSLLSQSDEQGYTPGKPCTWLIP